MKDISKEFIAANNLRDKYIEEVATLKMTSKREPGSKADISILVGCGATADCRRYKTITRNSPRSTLPVLS